MNSDILVWTTSTLLAVFLLLTAFFLPYYQQSTYTSSFASRGTYDVLGVNETDEIFAEIQGFLNGDGELPEALSERAKDHMHDVRPFIAGARTTYWLVMFFYVVSFITLYRVDESRIGDVFRYAGLATIGVIILVGGMAMVSFDWFWTVFHEILFPQGNWRFPPDSVLITLFPPGFFEAFARQVVLYALVLGGASIVASWQATS
jgi:uncharacterized membrane protein